MGTVLTTLSTVICGHGGKVLVVGSPKLTVLSGSVLLEAGVLQPVDTIATKCTITPPPASNVPCTAVLSVDATSLSKKLRISGFPVVVAPLTGSTNGSLGGVTPQKLLTATANQTKLIAI